MSIHCLICGLQDNWRDRPNGERYEVRVTDKTWAVIKIYRDSILGEKTKKQRSLDEFWAHRDCLHNWIIDCGGEPKNWTETTL